MSIPQAVAARGRFPVGGSAAAAATHRPSRQACSWPPPVSLLFLTENQSAPLRRSICRSGVEAVLAARSRRPRRTLAPAAGTAVGAICPPPPLSVAWRRTPSQRRGRNCCRSRLLPSWRSAAERCRWLALPPRHGARDHCVVSSPMGEAAQLPYTRRVVSTLFLSVDQPAASRPRGSRRRSSRRRACSRPRPCRPGRTAQLVPLRIAKWARSI